MTLTDQDVNKIVKYLKSEYSDDNMTTNGKHTKYAEAQAQKMNDMHLSYKPTKGLCIKVGGTRIQVQNLENLEELEDIVDNFDNLRKISNKLPSSKKSFSSRKVKSI